MNVVVTDYVNVLTRKRKTGQNVKQEATDCPVEGGREVVGGCERLVCVMHDEGTNSAQVGRGVMRQVTHAMSHQVCLVTRRSLVT